MTEGMGGRRDKGPSKAQLAACFAALGVPAYAKEAELRRAYRQLVLSEHPDKGGDPARFHEIQSSYDTLLAKARSPPPGRTSRVARWRRIRGCAEDEARGGVTR
jgi:hypothetical protein